jgi:TolB protein
MKLFIFILLLSSFGLYGRAMAKNEAKNEGSNVVNINRKYEKQRVILSNVFVASPDMSKHGDVLKEKILANLQTVNRLEMLNPNDFIEEVYIPFNLNDFAPLKDKSDFVVSFAITADTERSGNLIITCKLFDVFFEKLILTKSYSISPFSIDKLSNIISDRIYQEITGEVGLFTGKILYDSSGLTQLMNPKKKILTYDFETKAIETLVDNSNIVLNPEIHGNILTFTSFDDKSPSLYFYNMLSKKQSKIQIKNIDTKDKILFTPSLSKDSKNMLFSLAYNGKTNIYSLDLQTSLASVLTKDDAISTYPSYSPDGNKVVYTSDSLGIAQIFIANTDGSSPRKVSSQKGMYLAPHFSPDGTKISFVKILKGTFYLGYIDLKKNTETTVTSGYILEDPKWITDENLIYSGKYAKNDRFYQPYIISLRTKTPRKIEIYDNVSQVSFLP